MEQNARKEALEAFSETLGNFHLPTWEELPDFELYMDQVTTLVKRYLEPIIEEKNLLTAAMVNNYVKHKIIPAPVKKKYTKEHLAFLLTITLLKQIFPLPEIRDALLYQLRIQEKRLAYNSFCQMVEQGLQEVGQQAGQPTKTTLAFDGSKPETILLRSITLSLVMKILSEKIIEINAVTKGEVSNEQ